MAKPRVFVSSTFYDLKHIRSSLENFIELLGFEPILSEKGHIAYSHEQPLDESCYREIDSVDIFVMIVGGRYGSERSNGDRTAEKHFETRYDSVTKEELKTAINKDIPVYIFVEKSVYADYENYLQNKGNETVRYAHVDSVNTLALIDEILGMPRNNPVQQFERYGEIEDWLRLQWAGTFRELLQRESSQKQLASLQTQVDTLSAINETLRTYMEQIITKLDPEGSVEIIKSADDKLIEAKLVSRLSHMRPFSHMIDAHGLDPSEALQIIREETTLDDIYSRLRESMNGRLCRITYIDRADAMELNTLRKIMGKNDLEFEEETFERNYRKSRRSAMKAKDPERSNEGKRRKRNSE